MMPSICKTYKNNQKSTGNPIRDEGKCKINTTNLSGTCSNQLNNKYLILSGSHSFLQQLQFQGFGYILILEVNEAEKDNKNGELDDSAKCHKLSRIRWLYAVSDMNHAS